MLTQSSRASIKPNYLGSGESNKSIKIWISRFTQDPGEKDMSNFDMFESRKEIRLDSSRVKRKLLVIKTSNQQRKIETRLDLPAVGFGFEKTHPPHT